MLLTQYCRVLVSVDSCARVVTVGGGRPRRPRGERAGRPPRLSRHAARPVSRPRVGQNGPWKHEFCWFYREEDHLLSAELLKI